METEEYLDYIANEIHRTIVATVESMQALTVCPVDAVERRAQHE